MKKLLMISPLLVCISWLAAGFLSGRDRVGSDFQFTKFGALPVLLNGRIQPIDSMARNALLALRGTQSLPSEQKWYQGLRPGKKESEKNPQGRTPASATEWLLEVVADPEHADRRKVFRVHHPEILRDLGLPLKEGKLLQFYSYEMLKPHLERIEQQARRIIHTEPGARSTFETELLRLFSALQFYERLKNAFLPEGSADFVREMEHYRSSLMSAVLEIEKREKGSVFDSIKVDEFVRYLRRYDALSRLAYAFVVPPFPSQEPMDDWTSIGQSLVRLAKSKQALHPAVGFYARMLSAYQSDLPSEFNLALRDYSAWMTKEFPAELRKGRLESAFNRTQFFHKALLLYLLMFVGICVYWLKSREALRSLVVQVGVIAFALHTVGLLFRMFLERRPPVTNLYSSAVFVGWGAVILALTIERVQRNGLFAASGALVGFLTLLVAHYLSLDGDTMQMLRAVLDTNAWLATHVVVINLGYSATYLAGFLGIICVIRQFISDLLDQSNLNSVSRMIYGILCFATMFSFIGTVLGGIWADQSWGRFWGWDPKENGALMLVLWNAVILHARWGRIIDVRGLMLMAIFGNIMTTWAYFGVNLLGIGLHNYGFMDSSAFWIISFSLGQLAVIGMGLIRARSFSKSANVCS